MIKVCILWAELNGYLDALIQELESHGAEIKIVFWRSTSGNLYETNETRCAEYIERSTLSVQKIYGILNNFDPQLVLISGWMDKGYLSAIRSYKKNNKRVKVLAVIDDQWTGSLRQKFGSIYYRLFLKKKIFDYMWVSGKPQWEYARRFGHDSSEIICDSLSANTNLFKTKNQFTKRFIYVGRFVSVKGVKLLINAYKKLDENIKKEWPLILIGGGPMNDWIANCKEKNISIISHMQPEELYEELSKGGIGCLPSLKDQWGVVVHEYSILGMPLLISNGSGAATEFLIHKFNGYLFRKNDEDDLLNGMRYITSLKHNEIEMMMTNSIKLSKRIDLSTSTANLLSIIR